MLDPFLRELAREATRPALGAVSPPSSHVLYRIVSGYLAGRLELAALYPEIVGALKRLADEAHERTMTLVTTMRASAPVVMVSGSSIVTKMQEATKRPIPHDGFTGEKGDADAR